MKQEKLFCTIRFLMHLNTSGQIVLAGANEMGCDSTINVKLHFLPFTKSNLNTTICPGSFILIHNQRFDESNLSGQILLRDVNQFGCDSMIDVNVKVLPSSNSKIDSSICPGGFIVIHNQRFDELILPEALFLREQIVMVAIPRLMSNSIYYHFHFQNWTVQFALEVL